MPSRALDEADTVVLVSGDDRVIGVAEKMRAHREGLLHRGFSILVFNSAGQLLLQRRSEEKYHSPGLWSNTCCGHPRPGEDVVDAAHRRLREEMGFDCSLEWRGTFIYRAELGNGLVEHEVDHVLVGQFDGQPVPNPREVSAWRWMEVGDVRRDLESDPGAYTPWLHRAVETAGEPRVP